MKYNYINEKELEKFNLIFNMANSLKWDYKDNKMGMYKRIGEEVNLSFETIRKILFKTLIIRNIRQNRYIVPHKFYDVSVYLTKLNNRRSKLKKEKENREIQKHYEAARIIRRIARQTRNKTSAKTMSKIIRDETNVYYSPKHIYWLVANNRMCGVSLNMFPYKKYGKYYKKTVPETKRRLSIPIWKRPVFINTRQRFGDVEIDTVEGSKRDRKFLSTMLDRKSKRLSITLYENKSSTNFLEAVKTNMDKMIDNVLSITSDNGSENWLLGDLNIDWYSTNAYSSWQKGSIEQKHKQIRKFIPKGKSFDKLNQEICDLIALVINVETYLQNSDIYQLGHIVTEEELKIYKELISGKEPNKIFMLW